MRLKICVTIIISIMNAYLLYIDSKFVDILFHVELIVIVRSLDLQADLFTGRYFLLLMSNKEPKSVMNRNALLDSSNITNCLYSCLPQRHYHKDVHNMANRICM